MEQTKVISLLLTVSVLLGSCISPYDPHLGKSLSNSIVVSGQITDMEGPQTVYVSLASPVSDPGFVPVSNCRVFILDDKGNTFSLYESGQGQYTAWIDKSYLNPGTSYKVQVITASNNEIMSDFETMPECPEVDSVYYMRKDLPGYNNSDTTKGIQFYLNLDGKNINTHFFRWELEETWEHHVAYPKIYYYDGGIEKISPPDFSKQICWNTDKILDIYTLSTLNLQQNKYLMYPLHYIDNHSRKFLHGYSLLVTQFSLTEKAYTYWDQIRINSHSQGGLYQKQPLPVSGNLHNITQTDQEVLGFFTASSVKSKRIFIKEINDPKFKITPECLPQLNIGPLSDLPPDSYPQYLLINGTGLYLLDFGCVDCTYSGGNTIKPSFWPN